MRFSNLNQQEFKVNVESGFSDVRLAELYGVSSKTISRWRDQLGLANQYAPPVAPCGQVAKYDRGCRCDDCRSANTARHAQVVARMQARGLPPGDPRHGTYTAYTQWACRCERCLAAGAETNGKRYRANRGELIQPLWTETEDLILRQSSPSDAALITGRTIEAVYSRRFRLGLSARN